VLRGNGEGVDLQRFCRHVIHHDLDWNPSSIEQRTGRIDRLGCKAEGRSPILVYLPYLAGTADDASMSANVLAHVKDRKQPDAGEAPGRTPDLTGQALNGPKDSL
jgi:hypothetical protein